MYRSFQDLRGFIHLNENPGLRESENPALFTAAVFLLIGMNKTPIRTMLRPQYGFLQKSPSHFVTHPDSSVARFSHDNMTGAYIARELDIHNLDLPVARWNVDSDRKYWMHPRDLIFYGALSNYKVGLVLLPLLWLMSVPSYVQNRSKTSGKCLWFYRFGILSLSGGFWKRLVGKVGIGIGEVLMRPQHGSQAFIDVFSTYFKNRNHPINIEIRKWYAKQ